ncbi:MAG: hypothetical protein IJ736_07360 [Firmicutes bacterium]|nr:hypothetical protein [Bacillota bacterium]
MNIAVMGFKDKRHIMYSLLKILSPAGRTAFITTNPCYRQLSEDFSSEFEIGDTDFLVLSDSLYSAEEYLDIGSYDFVIYDAIVEVPERIEVSVITDHEELYRQAIDEMDKKPTFKFIESKNAKKDEKSISFIKASTVEDILEKIENDREFYPITSYFHNKAMAELLSRATGMDKGKIIAYLKKGSKK